MKNLITKVVVGTLLATAGSYAVSIVSCTGCHGQSFEKNAMGKSKIVKEMSAKEITDSLKGYRDGTYGATMKNMMIPLVKNLSDADIDTMVKLIVADTGTKTDQAAGFAETANAARKHVNLNENSSDEKRIKEEALNSKSNVTEEALGLRKTDLYSESKTEGAKADYDRPAPGSSTKFERAFKDAPPMIPHSVEGLLPITKMNNQCLGCHLPEVASAVGSTPIPATHFTNYRPETVLKDNKVLKEGKEVGKELANTSDIVLAKAKKEDTLYKGRFNCTQCHAPQSKMETAVANTFRPDFDKKTYKEHSSLADAMNEGIE